MRPRLERHYLERVRPRLMEAFGYKNVLQVPRLEKIVLNVGLGEAPRNPKLLESVVEELGLITGQRPVVTRARKAISNFGIRQGMPVGVMVTLRRARISSARAACWRRYSSASRRTSCSSGSKRRTPTAQCCGRRLPNDFDAR